MQENRFKEALLNPNIFPVTWELVPGRGAKEAVQDKTMALAGQAASGGTIHALTLTDNPGGTPAMSADFMGGEILKLGIEPLVHFTCKDKNRNAIESQLYALDRAGVRNLLVMSGDYPVSGYQGRPAPVFDLDPIHALQLISDMNRGLTYPGIKGNVRHQPSDFSPGAVVSPFKATEAEQMVQYYKLKKKIEAGAQFIVTQLGYDARKFHEVLLFMKQNNFNIPLVGNIYILPFGAAKMMNRNDLPGSVVTDKLLADIDRERNDPDKGERARILRAARMYAVMKGMGFSGVHIGGHNIKYEQVEEIIRQGEALASQWTDLVRHFDYPIDGGFYYFERDPDTGLNRETPTKRQSQSLDAKIECSYGLSRLFHKLMFEPGKKLYSVMRSLYRKVEGTKMEGFFHKLEHFNKVMLFDCKDCGDCALIDVAYLCPMSQCPKNQRNGACGGSFQGWCEVHPGKRQCVYVRAYARLKKHGEEVHLSKDIVPPCNWDLYQTSSWINFYLGKDHTSKKQGSHSPEN
ncbi:MAG: methylenetetrahydrofolate reductase C-terminal domain-containing protein [Smithellaceae bacterium]|nr:methylenetetrahydrofolate reductase C-terminal domain-containing protein [Smithellaceae bacterium]